MAAIFIGADGLTSADYFETAINAMPGDPAGFVVSVLCTFQTLVAGRRLFAQRASAFTGWEIQASASIVAFSLGGASNSVSAPTSSITADVGKLNLYTGVWDGVAGLARLYAKRVQVGGGTGGVTGGFVPDTSQKSLLGRSGAGAPATGVAIYGVLYSPGIPSLAQIQAHYDAVMAEERMVGLPGLPGAVIDLTQDARANGGALPATLTDRGVGGTNFSKVGAPTTSNQYARAWGW